MYKSFNRSLIHTKQPKYTKIKVSTILNKFCIIKIISSITQTPNGMKGLINDNNPICIYTTIYKTKIKQSFTINLIKQWYTTR